MVLTFMKSVTTLVILGVRAISADYPGYVCGISSSASRTDTFLADKAPVSALNSAQACANFCFTVSSCGGFFFETDTLCQLFSCLASTTTVANPGSEFTAYNMTCFACLATTTSVSHNRHFSHFILFHSCANLLIKRHLRSVI